MVADETKSKMPEKTKIIISILLILFVLSAGALVIRIIYLNYVADKGTTVVVPDNLIGDDEVSSNDFEQNGSSGQISEKGDSYGTVSAPQTENSSVSNTNISGTSNKAVAISLYQGRASDNEKFMVRNMLPGDVETKYFAVKVSHHTDVTVYFKAEVTEQTKQLADVLHIKVIHLDKDKVIYEGTFADMNIDGYGEIFSATEETETVAYYKVEVSLPTSTGNEYQAASLKADFMWLVKDTQALDIPQTGDNSNIVLWMIVMGSSFAILFLLLDAKRREREVGQHAKE